MKEHILLTRGTCGVHTGSRPCFTHMLGTAGHNTAQYHELNNGITSAVVPPLKNCGEGKSLSSKEKFAPPREVPCTQGRQSHTDSDQKWL